MSTKSLSFTVDTVHSRARSCMQKIKKEHEYRGNSYHLAQHIAVLAIKYVNEVDRSSDDALLQEMGNTQKFIEKLSQLTPEALFPDRDELSKQFNRGDNKMDFIACMIEKLLKPIVRKGLHQLT